MKISRETNRDDSRKPHKDVIFSKITEVSSGSQEENLEVTQPLSEKEQVPSWYTETTHKHDDNLQIYSILSASLGGVCFGMHFSWPSPSIPKMIAGDGNYGITLEEASYFAVISPVAAILTSVIYARLIDNIGRKPTILSMALPHLLAWILIASTKSLWVFYLARFFNGFADACLFASVPTYISEIATPKVRGTWGSTLSMGIYSGQLVVNVVGFYMSIQNTALICSTLSIVFFISFIFAPESPYYYLMKDDITTARRILQKLRGTADIEKEFLNMREFVERQMLKSGYWVDLFIYVNNARALAACTFLRVAQIFCGISALLVYTQYIFGIAHVGLSTIGSTSIFYCASCSMSVMATFVLDRLGRRRAIMVSLFFCTVMLYVEMFYFYLDETMGEHYTEYITWLPLFGLIVYLGAFHIGLGIVPPLVLGEIFPQNLKGKGVCIITITTNICVMSSTKIFQVLQTKYGIYASFAFFAGCSTLNTLLSYFMTPETKGRTLEEIQERLRNSMSLLRTN